MGALILVQRSNAFDPLEDPGSIPGVIEVLKIIHVAMPSIRLRILEETGLRVICLSHNSRSNAFDPLEDPGSDGQRRLV
ncbi:hypothetical protein [Ktedonospora formicarum]|uniref:hypothetical protein n=1 Tax=Ktedonospora formicarum TaxID=2778364 RepID=UPI003B75C650